jgi:GGDEF domain-containing protein
LGSGPNGGATDKYVMQHRYFKTSSRAVSQALAVLLHDPAQAGLIATIAIAGLLIIGLWGLYGDLFLSNMVVVAVSEVLIVCCAGAVTFLTGRLVRSHDSWQVESALTLRELLSEGKDGTASLQAGSPFHARQFRLRVEEEIRRCRQYGTSLSVVALRVEIPSQSPSRAGFSQANFDMAELATAHREALLSPTALGMFEYALLLPNSGRRDAQAMTTFVGNALSRYRCSFGVAVYPDDGEDFDALLHSATEQCGILHRSAA